MDEHRAHVVQAARGQLLGPLRPMQHTPAWETEASSPEPSWLLQKADGVEAGLLHLPAVLAQGPGEEGGLC